MTLRYQYFSVEDRVYRTPVDQPGHMERWSALSRSWERYAGDIARVIIEGTHHGRQRPELPGR